MIIFFGNKGKRGITFYKHAGVKVYKVVATVYRNNINRYGGVWVMKHMSQTY